MSLESLVTCAGCWIDRRDTGDSTTCPLACWSGGRRQSGTTRSGSAGCRSRSSLQRRSADRHSRSAHLDPGLRVRRRSREATRPAGVTRVTCDSVHSMRSPLLLPTSRCHRCRDPTSSHRLFPCRLGDRLCRIHLVPCGCCRCGGDRPLCPHAGPMRLSGAPCARDARHHRHRREHRRPGSACLLLHRRSCSP